MKVKGVSKKKSISSEEWKRQDRRYHDNPKVAATYDSGISRQYWIEHKYFSVDKWVEELDPVRVKTVLDFGCGTGSVTVKLLQKGFDVVSIDASAGMLGRLKKKCAALDRHPHIVLVDVESLPFDADSFDAIFCMGVLHHIPNIDHGVQEQLRVLKNGGVLYIAEPFAHAPWISWFYLAPKIIVKFFLSLLKRSRGPKTQERLLTREHIRQMQTIFESHHCDVEIKYFVYWPVFCGLLPEALGLFLTQFVNALNFHSHRGDSIFIKVRKSHD